MEIETKKEILKKLKKKVKTYNKLLSDEKEIPKELIQEINYYTNKVLSISYLLLVDKNELFYAEILSNVNKEISYSLKACMAVGLSNGTFRLIVNPIDLMNLCEDYDTIIEIIKHEMLHLIYNHLPRYSNIIKKGKEYKKIVNIATDCAINQYLEKLPEGTITLNYVKKLTGKSLKPKKDSAYYYDNLKNLDLSKVAEGGEGTLIVDSHDTWGDSQLTDNNFQQTIDRFIKECYENLSAEKRGEIAGHLKEQIELLYTPSKKRWQDMLLKLKGSISVPHVKTKKKLNRNKPKMIQLSGKKMKKIIKLTIAVDTSASMSKEELIYCLEEMYSIFKGYKLEITWIDFDSKIQEVKTIKKESDIKYSFKGRGGTAYQPVFDYLKENHYNNNTDLVLIFTDGGGESKLNTKGFNKVLWLLTTPELSVENPVGYVAKLKDDENFTKVMKQIK